MLSKSEIIDGYRLTFDPGDKKNGSLYIGDDPNAIPGTNVSLLIDKLNSAGLWSSEPPKQVADEQRDAYKAQLELVEVVRYRDADTPFLVARFDHEKFPSDDGRWRAWLELFDGAYRRV